MKSRRQAVHEEPKVRRTAEEVKDLTIRSVQDQKAVEVQGRSRRLCKSSQTHPAAAVKAEAECEEGRLAGGTATHESSLQMRILFKGPTGIRVIGP
jgi:hypothetical protein